MHLRQPNGTLLLGSQSWLPPQSQLSYGPARNSRKMARDQLVFGGRYPVLLRRHRPRGVSKFASEKFGMNGSLTSSGNCFEQDTSICERHDMIVWQVLHKAVWQAQSLPMCICTNWMKKSRKCV